MSYVRFAKDSQIYVWKSANSYNLCISSNKRLDTPHCKDVFCCPDKPTPGEELNYNEYLEWAKETNEQYNEWLAKHFSFDFHPDAGKQYNYKTLRELYDKCIELKNSGICIPDRFFARVLCELNTN